MIIRDAFKDEWPFIQSQRISAYSEYAEVLPEVHWNALKLAISSDTDPQLNVDLIVAEIDGNIVGSVALFPPKVQAYGHFLNQLDYPEIRMLAVSPEARGKGVAASLVKECIQRSKEKGYESIGLHTGEFMKNAIQLYERMGFQRIPQYDFEPANDGIIVKAFILNI